MRKRGTRFITKFNKCKTRYTSLNDRNTPYGRNSKQLTRERIRDVSIVAEATSVWVIYFETTKSINRENCITKNIKKL